MGKGKGYIGCVGPWGQCSYQHPHLIRHGEVVEELAGEGPDVALVDQTKEGVGGGGKRLGRGEQREVLGAIPTLSRLHSTTFFPSSLLPPRPHGPTCTQVSTLVPPPSTPVHELQSPPPDADVSVLDTLHDGGPVALDGLVRAGCVGKGLDVACDVGKLAMKQEEGEGG